MDKETVLGAHWIEGVRFNDQGLIVVIVQCFHTKEVLMQAWSNKEALQRTIESREMWYWSRSRQCLWHKGETSGHTQKLHSLRLDCDEDSLLAVVTQTGGIACHTGRPSCFYQIVFDRASDSSAQTIISPPPPLHDHDA
ncbi:MAG: phosphoribosyl-AMP cyclohydrolase [Alphaproteobacteria bacterium]|nr:phosphoribosyl-AMP cyclohydrolase [Alphaproteobacteria bacterium]